jgi:S1-C subfamily serine protease
VPDEVGPGEGVSGDDGPDGGRDDDPGASPPGGRPPHPLDRVWFHPSELSAYMASTPAEPGRKAWAIPAMTAVAGAVITLVALAIGGALGSSGTPTTVTRSVVAPGVTGLGDPVERVIALGGASVVAVRVSAAADGPTVAGSGVAIGSNRVLTSASLVDGAATIRVATRAGKVYVAEVAGTDVDTDLALVRVPKHELPVARFGSAEQLRVGQAVITLGSAGGDHHWTSYGVIAALDRLVGNDDGSMLAGLIETDVTTAATAAGGALLDEAGQVVGILSGAAPGRAVPIDMARDVAAQLASTGRARHGWLGAATTDAADHPGGGARIDVLVPDSPAAAGGLQTGDVVVAVGTTRVTNTSDLMAAVLRRKPGDPVTIVAWRDERRIHKQVSLGEKAPPPARMGGA